MEDTNPAVEDTFSTPWDDVHPEVEWAPTPKPAKRWRPATPTVPTGGAFTIPLICIGISLIACCLLIPAADEVRQVAYEKQRLIADLEQLHKQVATNDSFLQRVASDPVLAERLARRQMKMVPEGTTVLDLKASKPAHDMSPFLLVTVPPPAPVEPYRPVGGFLAAACRHPKTQLYLIGASLLMIASGLVLSRSGNAEPPVEA